jgi:hypothetical protein
MASRSMRRNKTREQAHYFNIEDGHTTVDNERSEHPDLQSARQEALVTRSETLRDGGGPHLWSGQP